MCSVKDWKEYDFVCIVWLDVDIGSNYISNKFLDDGYEGFYVIFILNVSFVSYFLLIIIFYL